MVPNTKQDTIAFYQNIEHLKAPQAAPRKYEYVYKNMVLHAYWHLASLYGLYLCFTAAKWPTIVFAFILYIAAEIGVTAGAHRLWSHRSYKAKLPLQIILMLFNSLSFQNTAADWVRDHRLHHKYSDTDADPHNASRGFFFAHIGWVFVRRHPEVIRRDQYLDMSDIESNPVLQFQAKYALPVIGMIGFVLPTVIPIYFWGESFNCAWHITMLRFISNLNATLFINSGAHYFGYRPYEKNIQPAQNILVSIVTFGEGFHNYHHAFPWDYKAAELGNNWCNLTTLFIDFFAWIGWAYDLKTVPDDVVMRRMERNGDGSSLWGWGDKDQTKENKDMVKVLYETVVKVPLRSTEQDVKLGQFPHHVFMLKLQNKWTMQYRAFCAGSIITEDRVITSANCFLTNRKRLREDLHKVKVAAGVLITIIEEPVVDEIQQWRRILDLYSQKFYKHPAYDLAILHVDKQFVFNQWVNKIPYASLDQDFDGICVGLAVKPTSSWSHTKTLYTRNLQMLKTRTCERILLRSCRLFHCTTQKSRNYNREVRGSGLICHGTNDPEEKDNKGLLVAVTSLINTDLPTLHSKVGLFKKWIVDSASKIGAGKIMVLILMNKLLLM